MKRWSALALVLMLMVTLASTAEAGKWRRWGRSSGFGWSDGYHAPSRYSHVGYHGATFWDGGFDQPAMQALIDNPWQGNVRELNHVIERAVLLAQDNLVRIADLALRTGPSGPTRLEDMSLEDVEAFLIKKALARYDGNVSHAANALGLSRSALYRRLQRYNL